MTDARVVTTFVENNELCMAVAVSGDSLDGDTPVTVEYIGRVPLAELDGLTNAQKRAALVAACKAVRDGQKAAAPAVPAISGMVTI